MTSIGATGFQQLDREFQRQLLRRLADYYPHSHIGPWNELDPDGSKVKVNLIYLRDHGLLETDAKFEWQYGDDFYYGRSSITKDGLDFLQDDGGLSAILGVRTIKLDKDTIKDLVAWSIAKSDLPDEEKRLLDLKLRELPAESIKHLSMKLIDLGLEKSQGQAGWLTTVVNLLGGGG